ncbi:MAG: hypothetical protein IPJ74_15640 [Saprospiraceae bacterium]|nr:hypothetical protein [Saprospiraceae bacterium]
MSYDLYCYKPKLDHPSVEDAENAIEYDEINIPNPDLENIINALLIVNPLLERNNNELNSPEGDVAIQIEIFSNHVAIGIPY